VSVKEKWGVSGGGVERKKSEKGALKGEKIGKKGLIQEEKEL